MFSGPSTKVEALMRFEEGMPCLPLAQQGEWRREACCLGQEAGRTESLRLPWAIKVYRLPQQ